MMASIIITTHISILHMFLGKPSAYNGKKKEEFDGEMIGIGLSLSSN